MDHDEEETKHVLQQIIVHLCRKISWWQLVRMPDSKKAQQHLWKFAEINDRSVYRLISNAMNTGADYLYIHKHVVFPSL